MSCNINAFFSFDFFMVYIPECKQQLSNYEIMHAYEILHTLNVDCSFITLRESCNNQRPTNVDEILNGFMLQIILTTSVVQWLACSSRVR
jgi:hypothetical protein